jgi:hypothetical protein
MKQETIEEAADKFSKELSQVVAFYEGARWQAERSQMIVPPDATNIEVFAIKPDENGKLFAYIGYKISNGNFEFNVVPFTEPQAERMYSEEEVEDLIYKVCGTVARLQGITLNGNHINTAYEQFKKK